MRLTPLRQSPKDSPGPMNSRQKTRKTNNNELPFPHIYYRKLPSPESEKRGRTGQFITPQGSAVQAPHNTDLYYPLPELTTRYSGTRRDHLLHNPESNNNFP